MKLVSSVLLLISISSIIGHLQETNKQTRLSRRVIAIDNEDLKNILISKIPLTSTRKHYTENFFNEFNQFLIDFSWNETDRNDVIRLTANYNKNHFKEISHEFIRLWISFKPQYDIADDIEIITAFIKEIHATYPGTISAVVLNYDLLQLDQESVKLVNHEIKKVNKRLKRLPNENLALAVQLDDGNCVNRVKFIKKLELGFVDVIIVNEHRRDASIEREVSYSLKIVEQFDCLYRALNETLTAVHSRMLIEIDLENGSYKYDHNLLLDIENGRGKKFLNIVWTKMNGQRKNNSSNERVKGIGLNSEWVKWLYQPIHVGRQHLGAVISNGEKIPKFFFENFQEVTVEITGYTRDTRKHLKQILTELMSYPSSHNVAFIQNNDSIQKKRISMQITLIVIVTKNDVEINKQLVENAIWAAAYANQLVADTVIKILIDWMSCGISETCSGYKNADPNVYCSYFMMERDMFILYRHTRLALDKVNITEAVDLADLIDTELFFKILTTTFRKGCVEREYKKYDNNLAARFVLQEEFMRQNGASKLYNIISERFRTLSEIYRGDTFTFHYVKVVGCSAIYSSMVDLTEFVLLYEKLYTWAVEHNITLYVDGGIENHENCLEKKKVSQETDCKCGWWVTTNETIGVQTSGTNILNKKALAVKLYESTRTVPVTAEEEKKFSANKIIFWILIPFILFAVLIIVVAVVLVLRYRSKYIMTREEVANFLKGRLQTNRNNGTLSGDETNLAENEPYNSNKYELAPSSFTIDKSKLIGSGEFGKVCLGSINLPNRKEKTAVKAANTRALGKSHGGRMALFGLLSEIKILAYLGEHDHIVSLLGAFTANLRKGEILIFLQFCELGSLYSYLRSIQPIRAEVVSYENATDIPLMDVDTQDNLETGHGFLNNSVYNELYGYGSQIACGMEFLASKNVVHADLATRNVLLTSEKVAKICDFGLSRRMYDYTEYVKQSQAPLPWRWMAPESLRRMIFNEKSDVWAFGVTLWEIFTLGDEPYPGLSYNVNFAEMLARGLQLPEPKYNTKQIYSVMKQCWNVAPSERPTFSHLNMKLNKM